MKVDLAAGGLDPRDAGRVARAAEALGFDGMWLAETQHDALLGAALALDATTRIEVGTAVAIAFARSPISIAQTAFDLAALGEGRFLLGLGTQVRGHVERRFGMPWTAPALRLEEWIAAMDAAWATWQTGAPFRHRSEHLDLALMPPAFSPAPLARPRPAGRPISVSIAGVGPGLAHLAGRVADGFQVHPFHTAAYLAEVVEPAIGAGEAAAGRGVDRRVQRIVPVFVAPEEDRDAIEAVRRQVAFYASTPTYRRVLALHGRERAGERLSRLAVAGRWDEMPALIDDELLRMVAVITGADRLGHALSDRVRGTADRVMPLAPFVVDGDGAVADAGWWGRIIGELRSA